MNKTELIAALAAKTETTKKAAGEFVDALIETVLDTVAEGKDITITGFGKLVVSEVAEKTGRNPQTGEPLVIPKHNKVTFKAGKTLKDAANK